MGRFITVDGGRTGPAIHVVDPGVPIEDLVLDPHDVWRTQPSVRKVVDFIARHLASTPLHVYAGSGSEERTRVREGRAAELLRRPAPYTTAYRFWHTIHVDGLLADRWAFVVLDEDDKGPQRFFRIPPSRFRVLRTEGVITAIRMWTPDGERFDLDPTRVVFDAGYSSAFGDPTPPIETLADILRESTEARRYRANLFKNGARVGAVIERPVDAPKWDDAGWERFKSQFAKYKAGGGDEGGTPILEDGMVYREIKGQDPAGLEILEARKLTDAEVAGAYHVAPELVGAREGTFANIDAYRQMLYSVSLGPGFVAWEQAVDRLLLPIVGEPEDHFVEAYVDAKLRGSFLEQAAATSSATGAPWMTRNEARKHRNLPPIDGGDELVTPLNVLTGGLASPRDTAPDPVDAAKASDAPKG